MTSGDEKFLSELLHSRWGLDGKFDKLYGEVDLNYRVSCLEGKFILKLHTNSTPREHLEFQDQLLTHMESKGLSLEVPKIIPALNGDRLFSVSFNGIDYNCRLLSWVTGDLWSDRVYHSEALYYDLGRKDGELTSATQTLDADINSIDPRWSPTNLGWISEHLHLFSEEQRKLADHFLILFKRVVTPNISQLRTAVIYQDANDNNILIKEDKVHGFIDFGDAARTQIVNELAVTLAYGAMNVPDPLTVSRQIVAGFHSSFPLQEIELKVLFPLVAARLLTSVMFSTLRKEEAKDNEYLTVSEAPAWDLLSKWILIPEKKAEAAFREACGYDPVPGTESFVEMVKNQSFKSLLGEEFDPNNYHVLDLSVGSVELGNRSEYDSHEKFVRKLKRLLEDKEVSFAAGGYMEVRSVYVDNRFTEQGNQGSRWRTVHLGQDVWVPHGTPLYAPCDGEVIHSENNEGPGNYGPTLILKHTIEDHTFYTLYGHLSLSSLERSKNGDLIEAGTEFAWVGEAEVNGGWVPHLHIQVLRELWDESGDFPGVAYFNEKKIFESVCPDPQWITGFKNYPKPKETEELLSDRRENLGRNLSLSYKNPLHILRGYKQYLFDHTGRQFLDTVNNVAHVGHEHPRVVERIREQAGILNTNTRYLHENIIELSETLASKFPNPLSVCYFVNSGSEANELALRMARTVTGRKDMLAIEMGYHGNTAACIEVSSYKFNRKGGKGKPDSTHLLQSPDPFRNPDIASQFEAEIEEKVDPSIAGFIGESILSCAGQVVPPNGYFKKIYEKIRQAGGICIADEVQVGFGRVGEKFWGFELHDVIPDIVTMGKPFGNGHPLAAVITTPEIADAFANGMEYFNTFGGNPVSSAIGLEVLSVIEDENLQTNANERGNQLSDGLELLSREYPIIADVRGPGLFLGFEMMRSDRPATMEASYLVNRMRERGILMSTDGPDENVIKIKPPLCISQSDVDHILSNLEIILQESIFN